MKLRFLSLVLLLFSIIKIHSQELWTLEKCIQYALDNNIQIKQQQLNVESSSSSLTQSRMGLLPSLNASANQSMYSGRTINPYSFEIRDDNRRTNNFNISSSVTVFQGFQKVNTMKAYQYNLRASVMDVESQKNNVTLNVAAAYMQILFNQELVQVSQNQVDLTKQQVSRTQRLVDAGKLPGGDLLDMESQLAQDEYTLVNAQSQLQQSLLALTQLMELKSYDNFDIVKPDSAVLGKITLLDSMEVIVQDAFNTLPDIKRDQLMVESEQHRLQAAKGYMSPSLTATAAYGSYYSNRLSLYNLGVPTLSTLPAGYVNNDPSQAVYLLQNNATEIDYAFKDQIKDNRNLSLMFTLNIPIFNGYQIRNNINQSRINLYRTRNNLELTKKQIYKDIQQSYLNAVSAQKQFISAEDAVRANKEAFRYATQKYENGIMTAVEYSTVKTKLAKSESDLLQAKYETAYRIRQLEFYRGKAFQL